MKTKAVAKSQSSQKRLIILTAVLVLAVVAALILTYHQPKPALTTVSPLPGTKATVNDGSSGNQAKTQLGQDSVGKSTSSSSSSTSNSGSSTASNDFVASFAVTSRSDGFHVATVLSGVTGGTCKVTITPQGGTAVSQTGTIALSGQTYMCDFGGDISGSGSTGSASLTVTSSDGRTSTAEASF